MKKICQDYMPQWGLSFGDSSIDKIRCSLDRLDRFNFTGLYLIGLWQSGGADNGFDVVRYSVDKAYAKGGDTELLYLIENAHDRGKEVGLDVIPNHISDKHPLAQKCLAGEPGYEDVLYVVTRDEASRLKEAGALSLFGEEPYSEVEGFRGQNKFVRNTFANGRQLNLNWNSHRVQDYFASLFETLDDMGVDFARIDCSVLLHEDISKVNKDYPLACINAEKALKAIREVAGDMTLYHEWFGMPFSPDLLNDDPRSYALDCSYVLSGKQPTEWNHPKLVPLLGGHDQMPFLNRAKLQDFDPLEVRQRAMNAPSGILFSDIPTEMGAMIPKDQMAFTEEDKARDADPGDNLRYLGRRQSPEIEEFVG